MAFQQIEAIKKHDKHAIACSDSSSSLNLENFPTHNLVSPDRNGLQIGGMPLTKGLTPTSSTSPFVDPFPLIEATNKSGRSDSADLSNSWSSRANSIKIAASYKAKWEAVNRRLEVVAANQVQTASISPLPTSTS